MVKRQTIREMIGVSIAVPATFGSVYLLGSAVSDGYDAYRSHGTVQDYQAESSELVQNAEMQEGLAVILSANGNHEDAVSARQLQIENFEEYVELQDEVAAEHTTMIEKYHGAAISFIGSVALVGVGRTGLRRAGILE